MSTPKWLGVVAAGVVLGAICGGALVGALKEGNTADPLIPDKGRAFSPVEGEKAGELANRFRPRLMFDSDERWRPQSIESLLAERGSDGEPQHEFCTRDPGELEGDCKPVGSVEQLNALIAAKGASGASTYLDIHGEHLDEYRAPQRSAACRREGLFDCDDQPGSAIYYHVTSSNERFYIDYWWFTRFNHFNLTSCSHGSSGVCDEHEGDWEGVTLVTVPEDEHRLDYVVYAAHTGTFRYPFKELTRHRGRPVVYVANGSHASYAKPCRSLIVCKQLATFAGLVHVPETSVDGRSPWARNDDKCKPDVSGSCLLALPSAEPGQSVWTSWAGLWGVTCGERCKAKHPQSPKSPGLQTRFQAPWCSTPQRGSLTCDSTAQGCSDWLGPLVAVLACNPSAIARALQEPEELPSGGLTLNVTNGDETRRISATTRGVVQALGAPLTPGSHVVVSDAGSSTEILLRAAQGTQLLEARFEPFATGTAGRVLEVDVKESPHGPVLFATRGDGAKVKPAEQRRLEVKTTPSP